MLLPVAEHPALETPLLHYRPQLMAMNRQRQVGRECPTAQGLVLGRRPPPAFASVDLDDAEV